MGEGALHTSSVSTLLEEGSSRMSWLRYRLRIEYSGWRFTPSVGDEMASRGMRSVITSRAAYI